MLLKDWTTCSPFLRQAGREYSAYASFGLALWREENASLWWSTFRVLEGYLSY